MITPGIVRKLLFGFVRGRRRTFFYMRKVATRIIMYRTMVLNQSNPLFFLKGCYFLNETNRVYLLLFLLSFSKSGYSQSSRLINIRDSKTKGPISFASITFGKDFYISNDFGEVFLRQKDDSISILKVSCIGYESLIDTLYGNINNRTITLKSTGVDLKTFEVRSFTKYFLSNLLLNSFKKSFHNNKNATVKIRTYSIENDSRVIESVKSVNNITFSNGKLVDIEIKAGEIILDVQDLKNQFKFEAINYLYLNTNPYKLNTKEKFLTPFSATSANSLLKYYSIDFVNLTNRLIRISFKQKNDLNKGYAVVDIETNELIELGNEWSYNSKYPLTTNNPNAEFIGAFDIKSTLIYNEGKWSAQLMNINLNYKVAGEVDTIKTFSYMEITNEKQYSIPISKIAYTSDYIAILSIPNNILMHETLFNDVNSSIDDSLINSSYVMKSFENVKSLKEDVNNTQATNLSADISLVSFWSYDWQLDWMKMKEVEMRKSMNQKKIDISIFGDFFCANNRVEYSIEPLFNYNTSYYGSSRDTDSEKFIALLFNIGKVKCEKLKQELETTFVNCPDSELFKKMLLTANEHLKKELFLCDLQCNGGLNKKKMYELQNEVADNLRLLLK